MKRASVLIFCSLFVCLLASASVVQAGGFALYEWSHRGLAMATTGYAINNDASVIAYNPAMMTQLDGSHALAGTTLISPHTTVQVDGHKSKTKAKIFNVPHAYYTRQSESNENVWFGVGMFTRFGLGTYYDDNWIGRAELQHVEIKSISMNPNVAFKFNDNLSVAVGVEILKGSIDIQKSPTVLGAERLVTFHTEGYAVGANIAAHYKFDDEWSAGLTWRAPMEMATTGSADYRMPALAGGPRESTNGQHIDSMLPGSYTLGVGYQPLENWSWEFDVIHTRWEATKAMKYSGTVTAETELHYKNTWRFQVGTEYGITDWMDLRFGYAYDQTPTRAGYASYMLPANDRQLYSTGLGFNWDNWKADWSFMYVTTKERTGLEIGGSDVEFKDGKTWITGMSLGYAF